MRVRLVAEMEINDPATFPDTEGLEESVSDYFMDLLKDLPDVTPKRVVCKRV